MIKAASRDATRTCASMFDPAIDHEAMTEEDYATYEAAWQSGGDWRRCLKLRPGESLTVFTIGILTSEELNSILDETQGADGSIRREERFWRLFLAGVRGIQPWQDEIPRDERGRIKTSWLSNAFAGPVRRAAQSIGVCVFVFNNLTDEEIKNLCGRSKPKSDTAALPAESVTIGSAEGAAASCQA